jgi:hypothetical protein
VVQKNAEKIYCTYGDVIPLYEYTDEELELVLRFQDFSREWLESAGEDGRARYATAETGDSRGTRRETICDNPSEPIVTPYRLSAASIVCFWCVMTMNCARSA